MRIGLGAGTATQGGGVPTVLCQTRPSGTSHPPTPSRRGGSQSASIGSRARSILKNSPAHLSKQQRPPKEMRPARWRGAVISSQGCAEAVSVKEPLPSAYPLVPERIGEIACRPVPDCVRTSRIASKAARCGKQWRGGRRPDPSWTPAGHSQCPRTPRRSHYKGRGHKTRTLLARSTCTETGPCCSPLSMTETEPGCVIPTKAARHGVMKL